MLNSCLQQKKQCILKMLETKQGEKNMYLVAQGKGRINQLGYDSKKSEYVYIHCGKRNLERKRKQRLIKLF